MPEVTAEDILKLVGPSPLMVEVGCNDGADTQHFLDAMPGIRLFCFEPDPRAIVRFKGKIHDGRVTLIEAAVSDVDGTAIFYGSSGRVPAAQRTPDALACCFLDEWDLSGSLLKATGHLARSAWVTFPGDRNYQVSTIRLDSWFASQSEIKGIDFLWIDVQGAEGLVFRGGQETLRHAKYCYFEYCDVPLYERQLPFNALIALLPGGRTQWKLLGIYGENALVENLVI